MDEKISKKIPLIGETDKKKLATIKNSTEDESISTNSHSSKEDENLNKKPSVDEMKNIIELEKKFNKRKRCQKHDKRRSIKRKSLIKYQHDCTGYDSFMNSNIVKEKNHKESPHIVIRRSLRFIKRNAIILKNVKVANENTLERTVSYEISKIGQNIEIHSKNPKYLNVKLDQCVDRRVFILVPLKSVYLLPNLVFLDEDNVRMTDEQLLVYKKTYVLVGMVDKSPNSETFGDFIGTPDIDFARKVFVNQIKADGSFHFDTSGEIFSFGFGPKYYINNNMSIGPFVEKKRKLNESENEMKKDLKKKIYYFLHYCIGCVFSTFDNFEKSLSPNVSKLQHHFDLHPESDTKELELQKSGILNAHLCLNAQTKLQHTECDSSYTVISVPRQVERRINHQNFNIGEFELNISNGKNIVIPLKIGTILVYSGYLLTHRQQIRKKNDNVSPFVNIVSYNSEKLFNHLMQSFRREILGKSRNSK